MNTDPVSMTAQFASLIDPAEKARRIALGRVSNSKLTVEDQEELAALELKHDTVLKQAFEKMVQARCADLDNDRLYNYNARQQQIEQLANVSLPDPDQIVPQQYGRILHNLQTNLIEANAITREARRRADDLNGLLDSLAVVWRGITVETVEWRADSAAATILFALRDEAVKAKAHARLCESCYDLIRSKLFALNWMMENYDRFHSGGQTTPGGYTNNESGHPNWPEPL